MQTAGAAKTTASPHAAVRPEWLALRREEIIEPELRIVDPHHHLWDRPGARYLPLDLVEDVNSGHRIAATVYVQSRSMLRTHGEPAFAPLGEVEFANGAAAMGSSGVYGETRLCAGIVGGADLALGDAVLPVLEAMLTVSSGRLCGIRNAVAWHPDPAVGSTTARTVPGMLCNPAFVRGASYLARFGLALDVWAYHTQLDDVYALARSIPEVTVVIDHFGGPVGVGSDKVARSGMPAHWRKAMQRLAGLPNTRVKLGGAGMPVLGFGFDREEMPPASQVLAQVMRPYVEMCVEDFGAARCMFESNFPVDKGMFSYHVIWNAFKRLMQGQGASQEEKNALFSATALETYRLAI
ncbi:amidohydrolase family protein [Herbaspirillum sp. NPDC101396]|uniref:amidohydrolase family protein n=1 Tax=Herbaspirillum sp. NPDC101396 TaxID=3364005 RepID=UPI00383BDE5A